MIDHRGGPSAPVNMPRIVRVLVGLVLLLGALFLGLAAVVFLQGQRPDYAFIAFLSLLSVVCGVTGINLILMRAGEHLYSAAGSMIGGTLSFTIGVVFGIWGYFHGVADIGWIASGPIAVGLVLYFEGRRRRMAGTPSSKDHEV